MRPLQFLDKQTLLRGGGVYQFFRRQALLRRALRRVLGDVRVLGVLINQTRGDVSDGPGYEIRRDDPGFFLIGSAMTNGPGAIGLHQELVVTVECWDETIRIV
jgi:hypothetical protein